MRRKSGIDAAKRLDAVERARRMTPEERLEACIALSRVTAELQAAGAAHRARRPARRKLRT